MDAGSVPTVKDRLPRTPEPAGMVTTMVVALHTVIAVSSVVPRASRLNPHNVPSLVPVTTSESPPTVVNWVGDFAGSTVAVSTTGGVKSIMAA
jgi:hypothetical protein